MIAGLLEYCTFSDSFVVSLKSWPNTSRRGLFCEKKTCSTIKRFFFFKYVLYYTVLSKYLKINVKVTVLEEKKVEIISLSSLVWGKSLTFYTCRAHVRALMKRKSCVRRNAILRNYLNLLNLAIFLKIANLKCTKIKCR